MDFSDSKGGLGFGGHIDCHRYGAAGLPGEPGDVAGVTGTTARYLITCGGWAMPPDVRQLIATHWHPDHIGGMAGLQRATGATAAAHRIEAAAIAGAPGAVIPHPAPARHRWLRPILWPLLTPLRPPAFPVATALDDGDRLPLLTGGAGSAHAGAQAGEHQPAFSGGGGAGGGRRDTAGRRPAYPAYPLVFQ